MATVYRWRPAVGIYGSPALPGVPVTCRAGRLNGALPGAVADLTASQRVKAEGIRLADLTLGPDCAGWAETLSRHLFTQASATATGCQGIQALHESLSTQATGICRSFQEAWGKCFPSPSVGTVLIIACGDPNLCAPRR